MCSPPVNIHPLSDLIATINTNCEHRSLEERKVRERDLEIVRVEVASATQKYRHSDKEGVIEVKPSWVSKTDPVKYPVRSLASLWQQRMKERFEIDGPEFTEKEFGQFKHLVKGLGDLNREVVEWMVDPANWWLFGQQVRSELPVSLIPDRPHIGFLLQYRGIGLRLMDSKLRDLSEWADFISKLDKRKYEENRKLLWAYAMGNPEALAKIEAAQTLPEIELLLSDVFNSNA